MAEIQLDNLLVEVAMRLSGHRNADDMVTQAVTEYIDRLQRRDLMMFLTNTMPLSQAEDTIQPMGE